MSLVIVILS